METLLTRLQATANATADKVKSETAQITVLDVNPALPAKGADGKLYDRIRVTTKELGNVWLFANNLTGGLKSYGAAGVTAKATLIPNSYKNKAGEQVDGIAVRTIKIEAIAAETEAMISVMPTGTALFATAPAKVA